MKKKEDNMAMFPNVAAKSNNEVICLIAEHLGVWEKKSQYYL